MKFGKKNLIFIALGILIIGLLSACGNSKKDAENNVQQKETKKDDDFASAYDLVGTNANSLQIGDGAKLGGDIVSIVTKVQGVPSKDNPKELVVSLTFKNNGTGPLNLSPSLISLSNNDENDLTLTKEMDYEIINDKTIEPGDEIKGKVAFIESGKGPFTFTFTSPQSSDDSAKWIIAESDIK